MKNNVTIPDSTLFRRLSQESLDFLMESATAQNFPAGKILVQQGDQPQNVYVVLEGAVRTLRTDDKGGEATLRMLQPGETCMEAVAYMEVPSPISVQTAVASRLMVIPCERVLALSSKDTVFANNLLHILSYHYRNALYQIDGINIKNPLQRVGFYFLVRFLEKANGQTRFSLPFKKSIIANYLGMTAETFSRTLGKLKELGVDIKDDRVELKDQHSLCIFCDSDTESLCKGTKNCKSTCPKNNKL